LKVFFMHPPFEIAPSLSALPRVRHGFFGRVGGVSEGEFAALNASVAVGDDPANVRENIHRAVMALKLGPVPVAMARQVHGTGVLTVDEHTDFDARPEADALVTARLPGTITFGRGWRNPERLPSPVVQHPLLDENTTLAQQCKLSVDLTDHSMQFISNLLLARASWPPQYRHDPLRHRLRHIVCHRLVILIGRFTPRPWL
jgi:hypothetical protein